MSEQQQSPYGAMDWLLIFIAVCSAATVMGMTEAQRQAAPTDSQSVIRVRELEHELKLLDAIKAVPQEIQESLGVASGDAERLETEALGRLQGQLDSARTRTTTNTLIVSSLAVAYEADEVALSLLDSMADDAVELERSAWIVRDLATLSGGDPSQDSSMLRGALLERAASDWLMKRVEARHLRNANRSAEAEVAVAAAREHATSYVRRYTFLSLIGFVLFLLGSILVLAWPWVRRTLHRSGHLGLGEHPSPFAVHSTGRVLSLWFLAFILTGLLLSGAGRPAEGVFASTTMALVLGSQTLLHGIVALVLIQRLGRSQGPHLPLTIPLRLGFTTAMRGGRGLFVWTIGGLSLGVVAVLSATVISEIVFGSSADTQSALELFAGMSDAGAQMIVAFSVVALAPFFEEVLFRGFVYRNLRDSLGVAGAVIVSSILFAVVHMEPQLILPLGGLGAVLAISFELSGSLIVPILVHAAWNLGGLLNILVLAEG